MVSRDLLQFFTDSKLSCFQGFYIALAVCLLTSGVMTAPAPIFPDPITTVAITGGAVTLTTAAGAVTTIPTLAILAGKALVLKGALAGAAIVGAVASQ